MTPGSAATQKGDVYSFAIILEEIVVRGGPYEVARTFMTTQEVWLIIVLFNLNFISSYFISLIIYFEDREQGIGVGESSFEARSHPKGLPAGHIVADGEMLARGSRRTTQFPHDSRHDTRNHEVHFNPTLIKLYNWNSCKHHKDRMSVSEDIARI